MSLLNKKLDILDQSIREKVQEMTKLIDDFQKLQLQRKFLEENHTDLKPVMLEKLLEDSSYLLIFMHPGIRTNIISNLENTSVYLKIWQNIFQTMMTITTPTITDAVTIFKAIKQQQLILTECFPDIANIIDNIPDISKLSNTALIDIVNKLINTNNTYPDKGIKLN